MVLSCAFPDCTLDAVARCELSWQPYCDGHLDSHSVTGNPHAYRLLPPDGPAAPSSCPDCGGAVRATYGGEMVACHSRSCGWMGVVA